MIDDDEVFDAAANERRRQLLVDLLEGEPLHVPELTGPTREMARANGAILQEYLSRSVELPDVDEELLRLHHVHLPKLVEYGFVEWDRDANVVLRGWRFDEVKHLIEFLADRETSRRPTEPLLALVDDGSPDERIDEMTR